MLGENRLEVRDVVDARGVAHRHGLARWGGIAAGMFTVLALLVLHGEIGMAIGMSSYSAGDRAAPYLVGAGIWGLISAIVSFLGGGYVAGAFSQHSWPKAGAAQGLIVWAVAVPVIGVLAALIAIGTVTAAGVTTIAAVQADPAAAAEARELARTAASTTAAGKIRAEFDRTAPAGTVVEKASKAAGAVGWGAVAALILSLAAAVLGGWLGTRCTCFVERTTVATVPVTRDVPFQP